MGEKISWKSQMISSYHINWKWLASSVGITHTCAIPVHLWDLNFRNFHRLILLMTNILSNKGNSFCKSGLFFSDSLTMLCEMCHSIQMRRVVYLRQKHVAKFLFFSSKILYQLQQHMTVTWLIHKRRSEMMPRTCYAVYVRCRFCFLHQKTPGSHFGLGSSRSGDFLTDFPKPSCDCQAPVHTHTKKNKIK